MDVNTVFDLMRLLSLDDENFLQQLQNYGLIRRNLRCLTRNCRRYCDIFRRSRAVLKVAFFCKRCKRTYSILKGSFFEESRVSIREILFLLWEWSCEARSGVAAMSSGCSRSNVIQQYRFFRDVVSWQLLRNDNLFLFGNYYTNNLFSAF